MTANELHDAILDLPCVKPMRTEGERLAYQSGHRDARYAAAKLALTTLLWDADGAMLRRAEELNKKQEAK